MNQVATEKPRVLVIEDEAHLAAGLKLNLELDGYSVDTVGTARDAGRLLLEQSKYDVIILDVMLPDVDGFELCRRLRDAGNFTPVIMLTARGGADDRVMGLDAGADDYLAKPFELSELSARVRSAVRRRQWDKPAGRGSESVYEFGQARIDFATHEVTVKGAPVRLTQLEIDLVKFFVDNVGRVITRQELLEKVWKLRHYPNTRTVDNFMMRLRKHFEEDAAQPVHFVSVRAAGYRFLPTASDNAASREHNDDVDKDGPLTKV